MSLLQQLAEDYGFDDPMDMVQEAICDSVCPAICTTPDCGYTTDMEPDQDRGYCEECGNQSVKSAMILMGVI